MGHWSIHIEGSGIHDNGRDDDAEAMLKAFVHDLAAKHSVQLVTFTVGTSRELLGSDEVTPLVSGSDLAYRYRSH